ncbi:unnamed protein product [Linum trigynum]
MTKDAKLLATIHALVAHTRALVEQEAVDDKLEVKKMEAAQAQHRQQAARTGLDLLRAPLSYIAKRLNG